MKRILVIAAVLCASIAGLAGAQLNEPIDTRYNDEVEARHGSDNDIVLVWDSAAARWEWRDSTGTIRFWFDPADGSWNAGTFTGSLGVSTDLDVGGQLEAGSTNLTLTDASGFLQLPAIEQDGASDDQVLTWDNGTSRPQWESVSTVAGHAPIDASFVTVNSEAGLDAERTLAGTSNQISLSDGGANGALTLSTPQDIHTAATPQFERLGIGAAADGTDALHVAGSRTLIIAPDQDSFLSTRATNAGGLRNSTAGTLDIDGATGIELNVNTRGITSGSRDFDLRTGGGGIAFHVSGTVDANEGRVGVGTNSPSALLDVNGAAEINGDLAVNSDDVTTDQSAVNLWNATPTTVNAFGAATTVNMGASAGELLVPQIKAPNQSNNVINMESGGDMIVQAQNSIQIQVDANSGGGNAFSVTEGVNTWIAYEDGTGAGIGRAPTGTNQLQVAGATLSEELSADPADPAEGEYVRWMSDGTGSGDDGDIMMKITAGGVTKTTTLVDFSTL